MGSTQSTWGVSDGKLNSEDVGRWVRSHGYTC